MVLASKNTKKIYRLGPKKTNVFFGPKKTNVLFSNYHCPLASFDFFYCSSCISYFVSIFLSYLLPSFHFAQKMLGKFPCQIIVQDTGFLRGGALLPSEERHQGLNLTTHRMKWFCARGKVAPLCSQREAAKWKQIENVCWLSCCAQQNVGKRHPRVPSVPGTAQLALVELCAAGSRC